MSNKTNSILTRMTELNKESAEQGVPFIGMAVADGKIAISISGKNDTLANMFAILFIDSPGMVGPVIKALDYCARLNVDEEE